MIHMMLECFEQSLNVIASDMVICIDDFNVSGCSCHFIWLVQLCMYVHLVQNCWK